MIWKGVIAAGWVAVLGLSTFYRDPSDWYELRRVHVHAAAAGSAPRMEIDRTIRKPFVGEWIVKVNRAGLPGGPVEACAATGTTRYNPANRLPPDLDLDWWTWPVKCGLKPGRYVVETHVSVRVPGLFTMRVVNTSNEFEVHP